MHSKVFEISLKPLNDKFKTYRGLYNDEFEEIHFTGEVANHVTKSCNRIDDINWLNSYSDFIEITIINDDNSEVCIVFKSGFKENILKELNRTTRNISIEDKYSLFFIDNSYGFYFKLGEENYILTLNGLISIKEDTIYYIGEVFDYHA